MAYSLITQDNFTRANTSVGGAANSTNVTGPGTFNSPSTGANYTDVIGTVYSISSNTLTNTGLGAGDFSDAFLLRPTAENVLNGQVSITGTVGVDGSAMCAVARYHSGVAYAAYLYLNTATFAIAKIGSGSGVQAVLASAVPAGVNGTTPYIITLQFNGASPTTLTATLAAAATPGTIISTLNITDSTAALQTAGQQGLTVNQTNAGARTKANITNLLTYQVAAVSPAANITITPTSATVGAGGTQVFSVSADGYLANGMTLTVNLATTTGSLSAASLAFVGDGATIPTAQNVTLTAGAAGTGALTGTHTESGGTQTLADFASVPITVTSTALLIGTLSATPTQSGIVLSLSSGLSGGSGAGFSYAIYRGTDPNFTPGAGNLLTTVSSMPYTDTTAVAGTEYYYGVIGSDNASHTVAANPAGLGSWTPSYTPLTPAMLHTTGLNIVFAGDSITYGSGVTNPGTVSSPTMPFFCLTKIKRLLGIRNVAGSNQGHTGHTLTDFAPGGSDYTAAKAAMNTLNTANPTWQQVFSVMLGTNDSAQSGTNNSPYTGSLTPSQYGTKLAALITQLLTDFPASKIFIHQPTYYSPNFHNSSNYEQIGLSALVSYFQIIKSTVASYAASNPGQVYVGDTYAFQYFAENYQAELQAEAGSSGTFYVHPSGTAGSNGLIGTQSLGELHAEAIALALYGPKQLQSGVTYYRVGR